MKELTQQNITEIIKANFFKLFDEKCGIISEIQEYGDLLKTSLHSYYASSKLSDNTSCNGSAVSLNREIGLSKSIGECLERYCLFMYDHKYFVQTCCNSLDNKYPCIRPEQVEIYTLEELERLSFYHYTDTFQTFFCTGYNITKKMYQYVPLPLVYLRSHFFEQYPEQLNIIQQTISTGAAFGLEFYQTAVTAIYEVIERDAMMAFWLLRQQAPKINLETVAPKQQAFIAEIKSNDIDVILFDISLDDHVFVILSALRSENPLIPSVAFSAAAHHDIDTAIQKSLEEVVSTFGLAEIILRKDQEGYNKLSDPQNWGKSIADRNDHVKFWAHRKIFDLFGSELDFIFKSCKSISREELLKKNKYFLNSRDALLSIRELLKKNGYDILIVDISTSDVSSFGFMSLKALIPGYLPLHLGYRFTYTKPKRLLEIAKSVYHLNLEKISLNTTPHPFP